MRLLSILFIATIVGACSSIANYSAPKHRVGDIFQGSFVIGTYNTNIPLPEGEWKLIGYQQKSNDINTLLNNAVLTQTSKNQVSKFIEVSSPNANHNWGYTANNFCTRDDVIHIVSRANQDGGKQDCWGINHWRMTLEENSWDYWKNALKYYKANDVKIPINALVVIYRKANRNKFVQVTYGFNPELEGFSPPVYAAWSTSDWHKDRYHTDKKKVEYIQTLKDWATAWDDKVDAGFAGQPHQATSQTNNRGYEEVTSKINQLKKMVEDGVITKADYEKKKHELLNGL